MHGLGSNHLDRYLPLELPVGALGQVNRAHAALAQKPQHAIRPDSRLSRKVVFAL